MRFIVHPVCVALVLLVSLLRLCKAMGKCEKDKPCSHYLDCKLNHVCARVNNAPGGDSVKNCKCWTEKEYRAREAKKDTALKSCWNLVESPNECIILGKCAEGDVCGTSRDCKGDLLCRKHKDKAPKDKRDKGFCTRIGINKDLQDNNALWRDTEPVELDGLAVRTECHDSMKDNLKNVFGIA